MNVNPTVAWICATTIIIALLGGCFALVWHGSFTGAEIIPVISAIAVAALAIFGVHAGVQAGSTAATDAAANATKAAGNT